MGLRLVEGRIHIAPCLPAHWPGFEATLTRAGGRIHIQVDNPDGLQVGDLSIMVDGHAWDGEGIAFPDDGGTREVMVRIGALVALS